MTEENQPKKVNLADAMKEMLAKKKQQQQDQKGNFQGNAGTKALKSQNTKKPNNQRRRTGGS
ncbi:hypothetical protein MH117_14700 [Paenibacillus sp. ACRRX]|uniref:hypothetical protein n=1 Tax=unclassified Paenibacillus TaxID=185978 RepID=UPI001EF3FEBE|nr:MULTISPECIES: hypothetical protein [unclassified Paenibacillus]MCG7408678.1 hypothetical protein [Paenibacillus sp. ACRRX]MDK8183441.1 hypothetical protein [Paenibacillus sp. UMB4589-SE434]